MPKKMPRDPKEKPQHERFKELARKVGADKSGQRLEKAFKKIVKPKRAAPR